MFPIVPGTSPNSGPRSWKSNGSRINTKSASMNVRLRRSGFLENDEQIPNLPSSDSVFAYEFLNKNCSSHATDTADLLSHSASGRIGMRRSSEGFLKPVQKAGVSWLRSLKLSPDIHSHNAVLELNEEKQVRVRTSKDLQAGEEMVAWFSEEIALLMNIPFLAPSNIVDNKCYTCHLCQVSFESPNPLKIHLAIACGQQTIDILWVRLHYSVTKWREQRTTEHLRKADSLNREFVDYRQRYSAFRPIIPARTLDYAPPISRLAPAEPSGGAAVNAAAQIETIVSNMGTSKQGHLCIYCGKIYSRKYGLKIHIRTHTGFKPLKCKFCLRPFGDPSNLNKHVRLHMQAAGSSVFKCHLCQKVMVRRRDLQRHLQSRHSSTENFTIETSSSDDS